MPDLYAFKEIANEGWRHLDYEPFQPGVEVHWLIRGKPEVALLRYAPGASVPRHQHAGMETILVLDGSQSDDEGRYGKGTFVINPSGTEHSVWSEDGCVVLIQWETPVVFV